MSKDHSIYAESLFDINARGSNNVIRLVRPLLLSGKWRDHDLYYELKTFSQKYLPPYAALSYSWGAKKRTSTIYLDNGDFKQPLEVTTDLEDALRSIRVHAASDKPEIQNWTGWLWVDQICINQANDLEKADQVGRMKEIYSGAECVFVWLGREMRDQEDILAVDGKAPQCGLSFSKIRDLLQQESKCWWNRLWVIQEISFCEHVFVWVGNHCFSWSDFVTAFYARMDQLTIILAEGNESGDWAWKDEIPTEIAKQQLKSLNRLRARQRAQHNGEDLLGLLRLTSPSGVSNELDRVYSLLGLATDDYRENVKVKYGIHRAILYAAVVQHTVMQSGNLNVLFDVWPRGSGPPAEDVTPKSRLRTLELPNAHGVEFNGSLPTWMPDFGQVAQSITKHITLKGFHAATFSLPKIAIDKDMELSVTAVGLGNVERLYIHPSDASTREERAVVRIASSHAFRPLICFTTTQGYCGFGSFVEIGDEIVVPLGATAPFVLRHLSTARHVQTPEATSLLNSPISFSDKPAFDSVVYKLISDCRVEGVMYGQLGKMIDSGLNMTQIYRIR